MNTRTRSRSHPNSHAIGEAKERLAESFLIERGLRLVARNQRSRFGEIDLVMRDKAALVFVEVRYRRSMRFGTPEATVDARKQRRLILAAQHYLSLYPTQLACRFDVVAIGAQDDIHWIRQAFSL
ncbi:YraN family protein [Thermochromatium tepidum]|jgi:conserved hypothetical protein TIGR00252|uniref:UPF0102 protein E6P07_01910 n=1 Tax=Thermochromatium tepidum ATCC 43061 TaxID=316276 RepID=A0A6I6DWI8_THETI|nr:YraN family protein [Thermochromatium tepidum]QGU31844.1 YraN family protein [Thermochromatium tepidum ATCC 43061]